jgi:hypothetical protein
MDAAAVDGPVDATLWVSLAEAGRRQTPPVSREAVRKRVEGLTKAGRLTTRPGPRGAVLVNIAAYLRAVRDETDPAQSLRNGTPLFDEPAGDADDDEQGSGAGSGYHDARAQREKINAESARLDLEERIGKLTLQDDIDRRTMQVWRTARDRMLAWPSRVADKVAAQPDARAVRAVLQDEVRRLLDSIAAAFEDLEASDEAPAGEHADDGGSI